MLLSLSEIKFILKLDDIEDEQRDTILTGLIRAAQAYILNACGDVLDKDKELAKTAAAFLLQIWYFGESADTAKLTRTLESILKSIS